LSCRVGNCCFLLTGGEQISNNFFNDAQFLADLCRNFEEISVKKKRLASVPPVLLENLAQSASSIAESVAISADFEMVRLAMSGVVNMAGSGSVQSVLELKYDEHFVVQRRTQRLEEFLDLVTAIVVGQQQRDSTGVVRMEARTLFFALLKKALELFLTKHNQVNSFELGNISLCCYRLFFTQ
jgi:hypothetical protein